MPTADSIAKAAAAKAAAAQAAAMQKAREAIRQDDIASAKKINAAKTVANMSYSQANASGIDNGIVRAAQQYVISHPDTTTIVSGNTSGGSNSSGSKAMLMAEANDVNTGGGGGGGTVSTAAVAGASAVSPIKIATSNLFIFDDAALAIESMTDMVFEDIGGHELIDITRSDLAYDIQTQTAPYQPISNLSSLTNRYSPKSLVGLQGTADRYFSTLALDLDSYIPMVASKDSGNVYIDDTNNVVIEVVNINFENNERVEVEILTYENIY